MNLGIEIFKFNAMKSSLIFLLLISGAILNAQEGFLYPKNTVVRNTGVSAFVENLKQVVQSKDTTGLYGYIDEDILNSFGGNGGISEFKQYWNMAGEGLRIWKILDELLKLGGTLNLDLDSKNVVGATWPYTFTEFPDKLDAYDYVIVTGSGVAMRKESSVDSEIITRLSYNILEFDNELTYSNPDNPMDEELDEARWFAVKYNGEIGYMSAKYIRSPIDYRMTIFLTEDGWKITMLIAGD
jgi:hypothetical protein